MQPSLAPAADVGEINWGVSLRAVRAQAVEPLAGGKPN